MTYSSHDKVLKQLENKPSKLKKWAKYNKPKERSCGWAKSKCVRCGRKGRAHPACPTDRRLRTIGWQTARSQ